MKIKGLIVMIGVSALILGSCTKSSLKNTKLRSKEDSLSYAFGVVNYNALTSDSLMLDPMIVAKAMMDGRDGKTLMDDDASRSFIMAFISERETIKTEKQAEMNKETYKEYIEQNNAFLEANKNKTGITTTPSGLQYEVIRMGKGAKPNTESTVKVHYVGTLIDGSEFDSSVKRMD
jgi:FKBP-type peptidyl-prolyl cis-trans isomerase